MKVVTKLGQKLSLSFPGGMTLCHCSKVVVSLPISLISEYDIMYCLLLFVPCMHVSITCVYLTSFIYFMLAFFLSTQPSN